VQRYPSAVLLHGPGARDEALVLAARLGRILRQPVGDDGLKIADSREIVDLLSSAPAGDGPGSLVIGPMDRANRMVSDALLKSLEEFDDRTVRPVLWAADEGDVSPTIRSRCLQRWCPASADTPEDDDALGRAVLDAAARRDAAALIEATREKEPREVLDSLSRALARVRCDGVWHIWNSAREVLGSREPTMTEVLAALL